jgi:hypothetical protein
MLLSGAQIQNGHTGLETDYCNQLRVTGPAQKVQKACHKGFQHGLTATTRALSVHMASAGNGRLSFVATGLCFGLKHSKHYILCCHTVA